ncbi:hypothetical protein [Azospirillum agricola]|uniref:hypothetical protein n=1 Tax=Azospirillum agricola TaxID=1720247 RepID=UPI000A0F1554|nr:hypothetical protein [Azospirillum agricola]SMH41905.1 hypothetical protein SAMN02982994_1785 [Azospirillum lipoferum]
MTVSAPFLSGRAASVRPSALLLTAVLGLLLFGIAVAGVLVFTATAPTFYGTALAPHSDALTSWLHGTLGFYFYGVSHNTLLLRPSISVLYSGILTLTGLGGGGWLGAIPLVFAGLYGLALIAVFPLLETRGRLALLCLSGLALAARGPLIGPLAPDSLNTDFPGFAFTMAGLLLALVPLAQPSPTAGSRALMLVGWFFLGFAAATRGPGMLFGPALLLVLLLHARVRTNAWRSAVTVTAAAGLAFLAPLVGDSALRAAIGVDAQGLIAFYSFYSDPSHTLTNEAYFRFVELRPGVPEVLRGYLGFLLSDEGRRVVWGAFVERLGIDGLTLLGIGFPLVMAGAWMLDAALTAGAAWRVGGSPLRALLTPAFPVKLGLVLAGFAPVIAAALLPELASHATPAMVVLAVCGLTLAWALPTGRVVPAAFALVYLLGILFVVLTGTKYYSRVVHGFVLALYAGPLWVLLDPAGRVEWGAARRSWAAAVAGLFTLGMLFLLGATFILPTPMKALYRAEVMGRPAAIKISEDPGLDRALYFSGGREVLYTRADGLPVGTLRSTVGFENPNGTIGVPEEIDGLRAFNALFENPGRFVE